MRSIADENIECLGNLVENNVIHTNTNAKKNTVQYLLALTISYSIFDLEFEEKTNKAYIVIAFWICLTVLVVLPHGHHIMIKPFRKYLFHMEISLDWMFMKLLNIRRVP